MESQANIAILIGIGSLIMLCIVLVVVVFFNVHKKKIFEKEAKIQAIQLEKQLEVFRAATDAEENERKKIAAILHDETAAILSAVQRSVDKNIKDYELNKFDLKRLKSDLQFIEQALEGIRGVSHDLAPNTLLSYGLIKALKYYMAKIGDTGSSQADFENKTSYEDNLPFSLSDQLNIYRICLEILNNLFKHAQYKYLKVNLENDTKNFIIDFMHDGKGITNEEIEVLGNSSVGLGLKSLKSRALLLNATINYTIENETPGINISVPFKS